MRPMHGAGGKEGAGEGGGISVGVSFPAESDADNKAVSDINVSAAGPNLIYNTRGETDKIYE